MESKNGKQTHDNMIDNSIISPSIVLVEDMEPPKGSMVNSNVKGGIINEHVAER
jgi:hypothetical protein